MVKLNEIVKNLDDIGSILVNCVDYLKKAELHTKKTYITETESKQRTLLNVTYPAFKTTLKELYKIEGKELKEYLRYLKALGFIQTDERSFTSIKWIKGKAKRVISIRESSYLAIRTLIF